MLIPLPEIAMNSAQPGSPEGVQRLSYLSRLLDGALPYLAGGGVTRNVESFASWLVCNLQCARHDRRLCVAGTG